MKMFKPTVFLVPFATILATPKKGGKTEKSGFQGTGDSLELQGKREPGWY